MKAIEGVHIKKVQNGAKKGQDYINYRKRYIWNIPEKLEGQIDKGDVVIVHSQIKGKDFKTRVLVVDLLESTDFAVRSVIEIYEKYEKEK